jgi:hypothetical protein
LTATGGGSAVPAVPIIRTDLTMRQVFPHLLILPPRSGEYRQAAGAIASVIATLLSRQCGYSAVSLVFRMNFFQFGASCSFPESIFFNWHITQQR